MTKKSKAKVAVEKVEDTEVQHVIVVDSNPEELSFEAKLARYAEHAASGYTSEQE